MDNTRGLRTLFSWVVGVALTISLAACGTPGTATSQGVSQDIDAAETTEVTETTEATDATDSTETTTEAAGTLDGWQDDSAPMASLKEYVSASVDENSESYIPPEDRIAVFDMDGTLIGERFPTYFNDWLYIQRALYDEDYEAPEELKEFARRWEDKVLRGVPFEDFDPMERALGPKLYEGLTLEEYENVVRKFKEMPVWGFEGMTYGEVFFEPMLSVVKYLYDNGYTIYVNSATYRDAVRIMMEGTLDQWIPRNQVIGTDLLFKTSEQGDKSSLEYTMKPEEDLVIAGELFVKNLKTNKVPAMEREIGKHPVLAFGNSSGDFAMANYALNNPNYKGAAYMLLCDNTELDYGDTEVAAAFADKCDAAGYTTISMADDWTTIYGEGVEKVEEQEVELDMAA